MKIYKAKSIMGFYVTLSTGGHKYLNFEPTNDGKSMFVVKEKMIMEAIEKMPEFKSGYISVWMNTEKDNDNENDNENDNQNTAAGGSAQESVQAEEPASDAGNTDGMKEEENENDNENDNEEEESQGAEEVMNFACYEDAREYVHESFGVPKKKLMSKTSVISAGKENGVRIVIED